MEGEREGRRKTTSPVEFKGQFFSRRLKVLFMWTMKAQRQKSELRTKAYWWSGSFLVRLQGLKSHPHDAVENTFRRTFLELPDWMAQRCVFQNYLEHRITEIQWMIFATKCVAQSLPTGQSSVGVRFPNGRVWAAVGQITLTGTPRLGTCLVRGSGSQCDSLSRWLGRRSQCLLAS